MKWSRRILFLTVILVINIYQWKNVRWLPSTVSSHFPLVFIWIGHELNIPIRTSYGHLCPCALPYGYIITIQTNNTIRIIYQFIAYPINGINEENVSLPATTNSSVLANIILSSLDINHVALGHGLWLSGLCWVEGKDLGLWCWIAVRNKSLNKFFSTVKFVQPLFLYFFFACTVVARIQLIKNAGRSLNYS